MNSLLLATTNSSTPIIFVFIFFWMLFLGIGIFSMVFWIIMLVDAIQRKKWEHQDDKTLWILVIALTGVIGAIIYYFMIRRKFGKN